MVPLLAQATFQGVQCRRPLSNAAIHNLTIFYTHVNVAIYNYFSEIISDKLPINQLPCLRLAHKGCPKSLFERISANTDIMPDLKVRRLLLIGNKI